MGKVVGKIKDAIVHENGNNSSLPNLEKIDMEDGDFKECLQIILNWDWKNKPNKFGLASSSNQPVVLCNQTERYLFSY